MSLSIRKSEPAGYDEWERTARECPYATFFHTPAWAKVFAEAYAGRYQPQARSILFTDGVRAVVCLSVYRRLYGLLALRVSSPAVTYGGWISTDSLTGEHVGLLVSSMCAYPNIAWRENPLDPVLKDLPVPGAREDFTQVVDTSVQPDHLLAKAPYVHRKAVRKARSSGISVERAESWENWKEYYAIYRDSVARWKERGLDVNPVYPEALFLSAFEQVGRLNRTLWVARHEGRVVAGALCFYHNSHAVAWQGAALAECFQMRPNNLLYAEMMRHAAENGFRCFDLNPCGGFEGVAAFKAHLGAVRLRSRLVIRKSGLRALFSAVKGT